MTATNEARPLYLMTAFGLRNPWVLWSLTRGALDEWCPGCQGLGFVAQRPCRCTEPGPARWGGMKCASCDREQGCDCCRVVCRDCHGARLVAGDHLMAEDFGDEESRRIAEHAFPGLRVDDDPYHVRMDTRHLR